MIYVQCRKCGYDWNYSGKAMWTLCPMCRTQNKTGLPMRIFNKEVVKDETGNNSSMQL